jgi:hypothetical protein
MHGTPRFTWVIGLATMAMWLGARDCMAQHMSRTLERSPTLNDGDPVPDRERFATRRLQSTAVIADTGAHRGPALFILGGAALGGGVGGAAAGRQLAHCNDCMFGGQLLVASIAIGAAAGALCGLVAYAIAH